MSSFKVWAQSKLCFKSIYLIQLTLILIHVFGIILFPCLYALFILICIVKHIVKVCFIMSTRNIIPDYLKFDDETEILAPDVC